MVAESQTGSRAAGEVLALAIALAFGVLAGWAILNYLTHKQAIEHGGYVECKVGGNLTVGECAGAACTNAAAVCDPELLRARGED